MIKVLKVLSCLFFCFLQPIEAHSQDTVVENIDDVEYWKGADTLASVAFERLERKYNSEEFNYNENQIVQLSFWERTKRKINQFLSSLFPNRPNPSKEVFQYILILLVLAGLAFLVYRILFSGNRVFYRERKEAAADEIRFIEKNLEDVDIDNYLAAATEDGNFDLAIRYLYLANLQTLAKKGLIEWDFRKTNIDFQNEIQDERLKQGFKETTAVFNFIWFGGFHINEQEFYQYREDFIRFKNLI